MKVIFSGGIRNINHAVDCFFFSSVFHQQEVFWPLQCHQHQVCHIIATELELLLSLNLFNPRRAEVFQDSSLSPLLLSAVGIPVEVCLRHLSFCRPSPAVPWPPAPWFPLWDPSEGLLDDAGVWLMKSVSPSLDRLFFIWSAIFSSLVASQRSSFEMVSFHWIWRTIRRYLFTKVYMLFEVASVVLQVSKPYRNTDLTFDVEDTTLGLTAYHFWSPHRVQTGDYSIPVDWPVSISGGVSTGPISVGCAGGGLSSSSLKCSAHLFIW